jgi:glycosyltransferase involved in cell wall biosynthesis
VKVLILHQHFNTPEGGGPLRSYYLAKALLDHGIEVAVITGGSRAEYLHTNYEGIEIHYVPVAYENRYGFYKRGLSFIKYALDATRVAGSVKGVDLCYAISVPLTVGQAAIWIERKYGIPFYFEVGDIWPEAPVQMGFVQNPFLKHSLYWLERRLYKRARKIVALSQPIKEWILKRTVNKEVGVIPNMADVDYFKPALKEASLISRFNAAGKFVISYIGAVGFANGLDYFLECARACGKAELPVRFLICGDGAMTENLKAAMDTLKLSNLEFVPFQDRQGVRDVLNVTDASFICYKPFPILETGSPNKYFDGLAAGKMVIVNFKGWIRDEIEKYNCGLALDPKFPQDIVQKLTPLLEDRQLVEKMGGNARRLGEDRYSRARLSAEFVSLFENVAGKAQI